MQIMRGMKSLISEWKRYPVKFGMDIFPDFFSDPPGAVHPALAKDLLKPKSEITVIMVTRGAAKSIYGGFLMPIHKMIFQDFKYIILSSLSTERARFLINDIKIGLTSERLVEVFGEFRPKDKETPWAAEKIVAINERLDRRCMFHARGSGSQIAGLRFEETRPQLFVGDDLEDDNSVQSDDIIEKKLNWFDDMVLPALDPVRREVFVIGTTYKANAMIVQLANRKRGVHVIRYPILADAKTAKKLKIEEGTSIWESRFPTKRMLQMREDANANGTLAAFMRQYMLDPRQGRVIQFLEDDIRIFDPRDISDMIFNMYILVDIAYKKGKHTDKTGIVAFGVCSKGNVYVFEGIEGQWTDQVFASQVINIVKKYYNDDRFNMKMIGIESYAYQFIRTNLKHRMDEEGLSVYLRELEPKSRAKEDRIKSMIPLCERGQIHIQRKHGELKAQMLRFHGEAKQKDLNMLDAFSYYQDVVNKVQLEEKTGVGSASNRKAWEQFCESEGDAIGGSASIVRSNSASVKIQQGWY